MYQPFESLILQYELNDCILLNNSWTLVNSSEMVLFALLANPNWIQSTAKFRFHIFNWTHIHLVKIQSQLLRRYEKKKKKIHILVHKNIAGIFSSTSVFSDKITPFIVQRDDTAQRRWWMCDYGYISIFTVNTKNL